MNDSVQLASLMQSLREEPSTRKCSSETLAKRFNLSIDQVKMAREMLKMDNVPSEDDVEMDYMSKLLYDRGVDPTQVTPTGFWLKDIKSVAKDKGASVYYSINSKVNSKEEKLDLESIREELVKEVAPYTWKQPEKIDKSLVIFLSDLHVGMAIEKGSMSGWEYNAKIFEDRVMKSLDIITQVNPDEVVIAVMGDVVDGWDAGSARNKNRQLPQNLTNLEQYTVFTSVMKKYFSTLVEKGLKIKFVSVDSGNHEGHLCAIYSLGLESWLNVKYPQVETKVFTKFIDSIEIQKHTFVLTHGKDSCHLRAGMGLHLQPKLENYLVKYLSQNNITKDKKYVSICKADLHQSANEYGEFFRYRNTLALSPPSDWVTTNFQSYTSGVSFDVIQGDFIFSSEMFF